MKKRILVPIIAGLLMSLPASANPERHGDNRGPLNHEMRPAEAPEISFLFKELSLSPEQRQAVHEILVANAPVRDMNDARGHGPKSRGKQGPREEEFARHERQGGPDDREMMRGERPPMEPGDAKFDRRQQPGGPNDMRGPRLPQSMVAMIESGKFNEDAIKVEAEAKVASHQLERLKQAQVRQQVWQVLNAEQQKQLTAAMESRKAERDKAEKPLREKKVRPTPFDRLELTEAQKQKLAKLDETLTAQQTAFKKDMQAFHESEKSLVQSKAFDYEAWAELWDAHREQVVENSVALAKVHFDQFQLLSDEQKQSLMTPPERGPRDHKRRDHRFPG